jgi:hypothetical protein
LVVFGALVGPLVGPDVGTLVFGALVREVVGPNVGLLVFGALVRELVGPQCRRLKQCYALAVTDEGDATDNGGLVGPEIRMRLAGVMPSEPGLLTNLTALDLAGEELVG